MTEPTKAPAAGPSTALATTKPDRTLSWFAPKSASEAWFFAQKFAATGLVPRDLRNKPEDVFLVITHGAHLGMHPAEAVAKLHVVEGKIQMDATEIRARVQRHEDFGWSPDRSTRGYFELTENCNDQQAEIAVKKWFWEKELRFTVTIEEAKRSRWGLGKEDKEWKAGSSWMKTPGDMLVARVTGRYARRYCPTFGSAVYTPEEMMDMIHDADVIELKPVQPIVQQDGETKAAAFARAARAGDAVNGAAGEAIDVAVTQALEVEPEAARDRPEPEPEPEAQAGPITPAQVQELATICRRAKVKELINGHWQWLEAFAREAGCEDVQGIPSGEFEGVKAALLKRLEDGSAGE